MPEFKFETEFIEFNGPTEKRVAHPVTNCDTVPEPAALEPTRNPCELVSHGCYNQNIMKHVRPEHDYRTLAKNAQVQNQLPCSVITWMSP